MIGSVDVLPNISPARLTVAPLGVLVKLTRPGSLRLAGQQAVRETDLVRHIRLEFPMTIKMSGKSGHGVIVRGTSGDAR